ncbi:MerR family transcriptional regulator [Micromonospora gifhornensis]|uniref:Transcriptional regulator n=1 Tax=Micromonospora gifhornensis TaxID=84594 RepID=A0ABQ4IJB6_9ACTN|nr:MerR family transcriptional regulator [Micromonospora gifhornensis]GIJ17992.1 transcriptional regulator [Micromonospora gifhornensis]
MRISDLSRRSGAPVATIKFYLREKLLPAGTPTGRNQAVYGEEHLRQLLLIRSLTTIAQLDLSSVRDVLSAIADDDMSLSGLYAVTDRAVFGLESEAPESAHLRDAQAEVDEFVSQLGWQLPADTPAAVRLAQVLAALRLLGCACGTDFLTPYAEVAERLAAHELAQVPEQFERDDRAAAAVRSVLLGVASAALRRMAREHLVQLRLNGQAVSADGGALPATGP